MKYIFLRKYVGTRKYETSIRQNSRCKWSLMKSIDPNKPHVEKLKELICLTVIHLTRRIGSDFTMVVTQMWDCSISEKIT